MAKLGVFKRWLLDTETVVMLKSQLFARVAKSTEASCSKFLKIPTSSLVANSHPVQKTSATLIRPFLLRSKNVPLKCKVAQFYQQNLSRANYFRNDFLWRKARWRSCMFGLVGIGCFQEDAEISRVKTDAQYERYQSVCDDVKMLCPVASDQQHLDQQQDVTLESFKLGRQLLCHSDRSQYEAVLVDKDKITTTEADDDDDDDSIIPLDFDDDCMHEEVSVTSYYTPPQSSPCDREYTVDVIYNPAKLTVFPDYNVENIDNNSTVSNRVLRKSLPYHPNIVSIERVFIADHPPTPKTQMWSSSSWNNTKPSTRSMFIVSRKPDSTLKRYMEQTKCSSHAKSLIILQILEAVAHLERNHVAHRQIDINNFVVETKGSTPPRVLLTNFSEAFAGNNEENERCFQVPFEHATLDTRLMGSTLQAPEVRSSVPGRGRVVDYCKADAWNAGLLAFQILTNDTEGYICHNASEVMNNMGGNIPAMLKNIVELLLQDDPDKRLSAAEAADILHLQLFAQPPASSSLRGCYKQVGKWLLAHYAETFARKRSDPVLHDVCRSFFNRVDSRGLFSSFKIWLLLYFGGSGFGCF